jgi:hypothetical protein
MQQQLLLGDFRCAVTRDISSILLIILLLLIRLNFRFSPEGWLKIPTSPLLTLI